MKNNTMRVIAIILTMIMVLSITTGCGDKKDTKKTASTKSSSVEETTENKNLTVDEEGNIIDVETGEVVEDDTLTVDEDGNIVNESGEVVTKSETVTSNKDKTTSTSSAEQSTNTQSTSDSTQGSNTQNNNSTSNNKPQSSTGNNQTQQNTSSVAPTPTPPASAQNATASDAGTIATRVLYYINQYRGSTAVTLPNLQRFAQVRSTYLPRNFSHNDADSKAAATTAKYGKHIVEEETIYDWNTDTIISTGKILDYYEPGCGEAIGKDGVTGTIDQVAKSLADGVRESSGHWAYVGSAKYIGIGITYSNGVWYCAIETTNDATYG